MELKVIFIVCWCKLYYYFSRFLQFGIYKLINLYIMSLKTSWKFLVSMSCIICLANPYIPHLGYLSCTPPISWLWKSTPKATRCVLCAGQGQRAGRAPPDPSSNPPRLVDQLTWTLSASCLGLLSSSPLSWSIWTLTTICSSSLT